MKSTAQMGNNLLSHSVRDVGEKAQPVLRFRMLPGTHEKDFETEDGIRRGKNKC